MKIEVLSSPCTDTVMTYGLRILTSNGEHLYEDICTDREKLETFCLLIIECKPDLKHMPELIEDFFFCGL